MSNNQRMKKSIVVGDIGSTKSSWWVSGIEPKEINLSGFNPMVHTLEGGINMLKSLSTELDGLTPAVIWYYGAGVIDIQAEQIIKTLLHHEFPESTLYVNSDLLGAAMATCGKEAGTVAILGTGSHAAVFDGHRIIRQANALGYILGDEGGGCDIGKSLLQAYFYNEMPESVRVEMKKNVPDGRAALMKQLYSSPSPNQYLATFAQVAVLMQEDSWIRELVSSRFKLFFKNQLFPLRPIEPVHILGSIGCIFADLIEKELRAYALKAGTFLKDPSYRLFTMHLDHGIEKE